MHLQWAWKGYSVEGIAKDSPPPRPTSCALLGVLVGMMLFVTVIRCSGLFECMATNGTLIGASANVVLSGISNRAGYPLTFIHYLKVGMPLMLLSVAISAVYLVLRFG
jgi:Na+/H+ antiporter NhaD/arsenite permease-like protein